MKDLEHISCNYCGSDNYTLRYVVDGYNYVQCNVCSLVYVNPRIKSDAILNQYNDDYFKGSGFDKSIDYETEYLSNLSIKDLNDWDITVIKSLINFTKDKTYKLLDAGCGMGLFLTKAKKAGFQVEGLEFSKYAAEFVESKGLKVQNTTIDDAILHQETYDVIVMKEVIEHLPDPKKSLAKIYGALKPGGLLFMTTGNYDCPERKLKGKDWFYFMPTGHLYIFSNKTMKAYLQSAGFGKINVTNQGDLLHQMMLDRKIFSVDEAVPSKLINKLLFKTIRSVNHFISSGMRIYAVK